MEIFREEDASNHLQNLFDELDEGMSFISEDNLFIKTEVVFFGTSTVNAVNIMDGSTWEVVDGELIEGTQGRSSIVVHTLKGKVKPVKYKDLIVGVPFTTTANDTDLLVKTEPVYRNGNKLNACYLTDGVFVCMQPDDKVYVRTIEIV